jgi:hypothetical protein
MDNTLEVSLKQHTPLIHFLHDQPGATLRATELKPALDRYIIETLMGIPDFSTAAAAFASHPQYRFWLVGKAEEEQPALNYKLSIEASSQSFPIETINPKNNRPANFPAFFANIKKEDTPDAKHFSFSSTPVKLTFRSLDEELLKVVRLHLNTFFARHNFASRKTKGFGSFSLKDFVPQPTNFHLKFNFKAGLIQDEWKNLFRKIDFFHRTIRSGFNNGKGGYIKSPLFLYCKDVLGVQWDKKSMKQHFLGDTLIDNQASKHNNPDVLTFKSPKKSEKNHYFLIRDLLGLASDSDWLSPDYRNTKIQKKHAGNAIDRIPSPIVYKPFALGNGHYLVNIILNPIPESILGETFNITSTKHKELGTLQLDLPPLGDFSLDAYFRYLCDNSFNIENLIGSADNDTDTVADILDQLKANHQNP